jgi:ATP phosphoribosyltransferase regulatory subunit
MNEDRQPIRLPVGVRDFLPRAAARRRALAEALLSEFERWGYDRIITPAFEYADVLARGLGADARAAALRFVEPATGEVVALRPDITPQVARIAATRLSDVGGPIRLCYEGSVLRLSPGARGQRELIQAGVELLDAPSPDGDAEAIALAAAALAAAGIKDLTMDVGHVALVRGALGAISDPTLQGTLKSLIAKKDHDQVARLAQRLPSRQRRVLAALPQLYGDAAEVLLRARALPLDRKAAAALDDLERALDLSLSEGFSGKLAVDLGDVRGFEYYTGLRFAGYVDGVGDAVLRGGRYDDLVGRYGRKARATGFAIDVEAIAQAEKARGVPPPAPTPLALVVERGPVRERAFRVAGALRTAGTRAAVDMGARGGDREILAYGTGVGAAAVVVLDGRKARLLVLDGSPSGASRVLPSEALSEAVKGRGAALARALGLGKARGASSRASSTSSGPERV